MTRSTLAASGFVRNEIEDVVYWSAGTGPTLVLVHGANDQAGTWCTVAPTLARTHRVLIPDLPGHGETPPKTGPIPISLIVRRLETLLSHEQDFTLAGNSLGGWIVLVYALKHQHRIARLILESSGGLSRPLSSPLVARDREEALLILRNVHGPSFPAPEWVVEALLQRGADSPMLRLTEIAEHQIEDRLGEIRIPTTLIWGAHDGVLPLDYAHALQRAIPGSTLHVIDGAAHIPHIQKPERFLQCLTPTS